MVADAVSCCVICIKISELTGGEREPAPPDPSPACPVTNKYKLLTSNYLEGLGHRS